MLTPRAMAEDLQFALMALSAVFFVSDPLSTVPIFVSITSGDTPAQRRSTALRASLAAWVTLSVFSIAGGVIFAAFGISLGAFKIAGGIMLLLMAIDMMRAQPSRTRTSEEEQDASRTREDVAVFPLAIPMLAGPGAIATVMVLMSRAAWDPIRTPAVFGAITVTCFASWLLLRSAASAERWLPQNILRAFERIMGLLLAAVAVEFIAGGVRDLVGAS